MKPVLMIHEFKEEYFDIPLDKYILTFDDGLYTQYKFIDELKKINTEKIFFISSNIICPEDKDQDDNFIKCIDAHKKAFNNDFTNYMKWSQIKKIDSLDNCFIGCHSHFHQLKTASCVECIILDNRLMMFDFIKNLGYVPRKFCFPYNYQTPLYKEILSLKGFKSFYGNERIDINTL
mgnify:FL=1|tara:strand:+ start:1149 stop:1679 length:531 start_codon:yes stop_codon:yes gene_type:complete